MRCFRELTSLAVATAAVLMTAGMAGAKPPPPGKPPGSVGAGGAGLAEGQTRDRPDTAVLRLSESAVLGRFTADVRKSPRLREQALGLWRTHFEAEAAELERRFESAPDWRPVLAQAAALIDDFLEASLLPRDGILEVEDGQGWVEFLDPATGQRARKKVPLKPQRRILAPVERGAAGSKAQGKAETSSPSRAPTAPPDRGGRVPQTR